MNVKNNFISKLHLGCSEDPIFEKQNLIHFKDGKAYCTNGHIAIIQSLDVHELTEEDIENLEGKFIHRSTFKDILKYKEVYFKEDKIVAMTESNTEAIFSYYPFNEEWINVDEVMNNFSMGNIDEIGFMPHLLKIINECLVKPSTSGIHFRFQGDNSKAIYVTSIGENADKQKAILMPVKMTIDI